MQLDRLGLGELVDRVAAQFPAEAAGAPATEGQLGVAVHPGVDPDRTGAQLLRDFMRDYVKQQQEAAEYDAWLRAKVERSRASANAGNLVPAAEVEAKFAARRAATRRRLEASK